MSNKQPKFIINTELNKKDLSLTSFMESFNRPISANINKADMMGISQTSKNKSRNNFPKIYQQTSILFLKYLVTGNTSYYQTISQNSTIKIPSKMPSNTEKVQLLITYRKDYMRTISIKRLISII